ncbi:hypothetical protein [Jejuia spongiicola]|uniref:RDD domain-containing protein n=1 Tax=Jejuia spongiicola TaxID=2942207 RepID=A0ABT0QG92_9FLAO|nr:MULTISPECIES: hypothetical protein [Flavobacteriaceae]MCL6295940.1 hypothetical protein [Jejuia spongiicola]PIA82087.1 hypothetical protein BFR04_12365 [Gaetbulibacter sp. 4G1]
MNLENLSKNKKLALSILFDVIGMVTFIDIIWAPASAYLISKMYKGTKGKIAGVVSFIEEAIPGFDIIPTFTIMWFLTYVFKKEEKPIVVEVEVGNE